MVLDKIFLKKGLKIAHLNICSLRNKMHDITGILKNNNIHILAISETHLDASIDSSLLHVNGYLLYRQDRNINGGGVAFYVQDQIPVKIRRELACVGVEVLWLEVQLPHLKSILVGCCYRPPNAPIVCLDRICYMLDIVGDLDMGAIEWIYSYLINREFNVLFNGSYSETKVLRCGVPQGSCLGPLLFSIFINDLSFMLGCATIALYADDLTISISDYNSTRLNTLLTNELKLIENWIRDNKLIINVEKSKCMMLGSSHLLKNSPALYLSVGGLIIEQVVEAKLLGVIVDSRLTWNVQIKSILNKMGRSMAVVRHCRKSIPMRIRKTLVESIVLCHLDYCSIIWATTTENNLNRLQIAQNKASRLVLNCSFRTSIRDMHNKLAWLHVRSRIKYSLIKFLKNIIITKAPEIIYNRLILFSDVHTYSTRQSSEGRFLLPVCRTKQLQRTLYYRAMVAWNSLPLFLVSESRNAGFSKRLRLYLFTLE